MTQAIGIMTDAAKLQLRYLAVNVFMMFTVFVQPFFIAITVMFMLRGGAGFDPVFVVVGSALAGIWSLVLFDGNWMIGRERAEGTLELVVGAPASVMLVIGGKLLGTMLFSLSSMVVSYAVGAWLFGYDIAIADPPAFLVSSILALAAMWAMGLLVAPVGMMWRTARDMLNIVEYPVYILGGFLFSIALLPQWSHWGSYVLPPFWAALALHLASSTSAGLEVLVPVWTVLALSTVATVLIARPLFALLLHRARVAGSLALS